MKERLADASEGIRQHLVPLIILTSIFFINFLARIVLAPLLPTVEKELHISHAEAGSFFLLISLGYFVALLGSGFISARLTHRKTIILSSVALGIAAIGIGLTTGIWSIRIGLLILGLSAGLYFPSAVATLTSIVNVRHWGKALAIHEVAPNLSFVLAPLIAETVLLQFSWRGVFVILGIAGLCLAIIFYRYGSGGEFRGETPGPVALRSILMRSAFWLMVLMFCLGISSTLGIYTMLPLFLVNEHGIERNWANTLLSLSRIVGMGVAFVGGWAVDRFGVHRILVIVMLMTGGMTMLLGQAPKTWVGITILLQPVAAVCFFPAALAALSMLSAPKLRNITISLTGALAFLIGAGAIPTLIGLIGDASSFSAGITLIGGLIAVGAVLPRFIKFYEQKNAGHLNRNSERIPRCLRRG